MIEELKNNINTEIEMIKELSAYTKKLEFAKAEDRKLLESATDSLKSSIKILNRSVPSLLDQISPIKKLQATVKATGIQKVQFQRSDSSMQVALKEVDKDKFIQELSISENLIRKLKKKQGLALEPYGEFKAARGYLRYANRFFLNTANKLIEKGRFKTLALEIKKANLDILFSTYVAMIFLTTFLSIFVALFLTIFFLFFNIGFNAPFVTSYSGDYMLRFLKIFWIIFAVPLATFFTLYFYPSTEKSSLSKRIDQELPFAVIHMSAISGSGIEPSEIFRIIGLSKEYPFLRGEIRKVMNQINIYGYDLTTALNNVAASTPSTKLAELFNGLSTTINSGGDLSIFFEKRAETLLLNYRLERERYTKVAETFMDIYISVVIASPMILMLLLVMISVSGISVPFSISELTLIIVSIVAFINIIFLGFLQVKQPGY